ncbi:MAG: hypothetical protein ABI791_02540 [Acidobacteriota bacterium]
MKTTFRFLSLAVLVAGLGASAAFGQDACADVDGQTAVYIKITANYNSKSVDALEIALASGKEFLEKYGACEALKDQLDFVKPQVARLEKAIPDLRDRAALGELFKRYDSGVQGKKYDDAYAAGKGILAKQPDNLNILVPLGVIGLYQSYDKNYKYNDDSLRYAQQALTLLKSGKELPKKNKAGVPTAGVFEFEYTKEDAISELTFAQGYINYYVKNDKKAGIPFYYEVSQLPGRYKTDARVYDAIGSYYFDAAAAVGKEIGDLITKQKAAPTDDEKVALDAQIKDKIALFNGYNERILDAYSRAYTLAKSDTPVGKTYKDALYKTLQDTYKRRFEKLDGLDAYVSAAVAKPLPNPTSQVTPVSDAEPTKTTGSATPPVSAAPVTAAPAAKPAAPAKPMSSVSSTTAAATTAVKAPAKKTVAAKKNR